jgi:hypothetical protein
MVKFTLNFEVCVQASQEKPDKVWGQRGRGGGEHVEERSSEEKKCQQSC